MECYRNRVITSLNLYCRDQWGAVEIHDSQVKIDHMPSRMQELNFEQRDRVATMSASPTGTFLVKIISLLT
jgi:hypothetical protein